MRHQGGRRGAACLLPEGGGKLRPYACEHVDGALALDAAAAADSVLAHQRGEQSSIALRDVGEEPAAVVESPDDDPQPRRRLVIEDHGVGLDGGVPVRLLGDGRLRPRRQRRLIAGGILAPPLAFDRPRRVETHRVLGEIAAVGGDQTHLVRLAAQSSDHLGDAVHRVVVAGAAEERQTAGDGEAARIVLAQAELGARHFDRGGEAGVEIDRGHVVEAHARHREGALGHDADRRTTRVVLALAHQRLRGIGAAVEEDPALRRNAQRPRATDRGEEHGGALIDAVACVHQSSVGQRDEGVLAFRGRQLARRTRLRKVGVGIAGGDVGERSEEASHRLEVIIERRCAAMTDRLLEQRIDLGGERDAVRDLVGVEQRRAESAVLQTAVHLFVPVELDAGAAGALERRDGFGAGEENDLGLAVGDALGHQVDPLLRRVAANFDVDRVGRVGADAARHRAWRIGGAAVLVRAPR